VYYNVHSQELQKYTGFDIMNSKSTSDISGITLVYL